MKKRTMNDIASDMLLALDCDDAFNWDEWDNLEGEFLEKLNASLHVVRRLRADSIDCKNRAKKWKEMSVSRETQADSFEQHLINTLMSMKRERIETEDFKVVIGDSERIEVEPSELAFLPEEYRLPEPKAPIKPDKKALKKAINDGHKIPGVTLVKCKNMRY